MQKFYRRLLHSYLIQQLKKKRQRFGQLECDSATCICVRVHMHVQARPKLFSFTHIWMLLIVRHNCTVIFQLTDAISGKRMLFFSGSILIRQQQHNALLLFVYSKKISLSILFIIIFVVFFRLLCVSHLSLALNQMFLNCQKRYKFFAITHAHIGFGYANTCICNTCITACIQYFNVIVVVVMHESKNGWHYIRYKLFGRYYLCKWACVSAVCRCVWPS